MPTVAQALGPAFRGLRTPAVSAGDGAPGLVILVVRKQAWWVTGAQNLTLLKERHLSGHVGARST